MSKNWLRGILIGAVVLAVALVVYFAVTQLGGGGVVSGALAPEGIPGEVVYIPFPIDITLDGDLSDWQGVPVIEVVDEEPRDPAENGSFTFSVAADKKNFYITMQMPDKTIIAGEHRNEFWNEDSFEFYLNTTGNLETYNYSQGIFQININATDIGNIDPDALTITGNFSSGVPVSGFVFETKDGWGFEAAVPLEDLVTPEHGVEIGFQAQINGAFKYDRNVKLIWSNADKTDQSWENPSVFGRAVFFEVGREDVPPSSYVPVVESPAPTAAPVVIPDLISVNQTGYLTGGVKVAVLASEETRPLAWELVNEAGEVVLEGKTEVFGDDSASRDHVHRIDFSDYQTPGIEYILRAGGLESAPFEIGDDIYHALRYDALAYFYHNRSGIPIQAKYVLGDWSRPAGHLSDSEVTCFRGEDNNGVEWRGCDYTLDAAGGWYDAGDYGKYVVNGGISAWTLMDLYDRFPEAYPDGSLQIPENGNGVPDLLDEARWEMEFLMAMQVPDGYKDAGLAHHKLHDRVWGRIPMLPPTLEDNDNEHTNPVGGRYVYAPSTAATLNLAATGAQCARIWAEIDSDFSDQCLNAAEKAWTAARANPNRYAGNVPGDGGGNYEDSVVADEFYWAAAELYITTGGEEYWDYLENTSLFAQADAFDWGRVRALGTIALARHADLLPEEKAGQVIESIIVYADEMLAVQAEEGYLVLLDGDYPWGSNGMILNNMILIATAYDLTGDPAYLESLQTGMDYIMGRNALNRSFVTGYGEYPMLNPHHRFWANEPNRGFPPPPAGAVSGGPNTNPTDPDALEAGVMDEAPAKRYVDTIGSYSTNEVTINWNAPLAWVVTYLDLSNE
jgi:endoglucanase